MSSDTEYILRQTHIQNRSEHLSQTSSPDMYASRRADFSNSGMKLRSDFLRVPTYGPNMGGHMSSSKTPVPADTRQNTAVKLHNPSRFASSNTKTRSINTSELRSELIREYEIAFDTIETALTEKNFELSKSIREMEIRLEQKDKYIEETTRQYEQQLDALESTYYNTSKKLMDLQQISNQQQIKLRQSELQIQSQAETIRKLNLKCQEERQSLQGRISVKERAIQQLCKLLETERAKTDHLTNSLNQMLTLKQEAQQLTTQNVSLSQALLLKQTAHSQLQKQSEQLEAKLKQALSDIQQLTECKTVQKQSERILNDTQVVGGLMMEELSTLKDRLNKLTTSESQSRRLAVELQGRLQKVEFEKQTLSQYNKVLVERMKKVESSVPRQSAKWALQTSSTFCASNLRRE